MNHNQVICVFPNAFGGHVSTVSALGGRARKRGEKRKKTCRDSQERRVVVREHVQSHSVPTLLSGSEPSPLPCTYTYIQYALTHRQAYSCLGLIPHAATDCEHLSYADLSVLTAHFLFFFSPSKHKKAFPAAAYTAPNFNSARCSNHAITASF